jgi:hypothetical protein
MQLFYHFLGILAVIVLIHFIFLDIQNIIHLKSINKESIHVPDDHSQKSKINPRPKKALTAAGLSVQDENSLMMVELNQTLSKLQNDLIKLKKVNKLRGSRVKHDIPTIVKKVNNVEIKKTVSQPNLKKLKALIFTMDCITSYEQNSKMGGAAGELIIRHALEDAFKEMDIPLRIVRSDDEFASCNMVDYDIILLDSWTWAAKGIISLFSDQNRFFYSTFLGWVPKRNLLGHEGKIYILDFFGSSKLRSNTLHINIKMQVLTAFKSPWNTFLGYYIPEERKQVVKTQDHKLAQGIIWGKDVKYFTGHEGMLSQVANKVHLKSTATQPLFQHSNVDWVGHQSNDGWLQLLANSKFLLGLGHPLLGPSAVDAVSLGCMFINPIYKKPQLEANYLSQHPYIAEVAPDYVCSYEEDNVNQLLQCVDKALAVDLQPLIPSDLTREVYLERVRKIFLT